MQARIVLPLPHRSSKGGRLWTPVVREIPPRWPLAATDENDFGGAAELLNCRFQTRHCLREVRVRFLPRFVIFQSFAGRKISLRFLGAPRGESETLFRSGRRPATARSRRGRRLGHWPHSPEGCEAATGIPDDNHLEEPRGGRRHEIGYAAGIRRRGSSRNRQSRGAMPWRELSGQRSTKNHDSTNPYFQKQQSLKIRKLTMTSDISHHSRAPLSFGLLRDFAETRRGAPRRDGQNTFRWGRHRDRATVIATRRYDARE